MVKLLEEEWAVYYRKERNNFNVTTALKAIFIFKFISSSTCGASIKVFDLLSNDTSLRDQLERNTAYLKEQLINLGFDIIDGESAIVPVMLYDAKLAQEMANLLLKEGIYVIGFFYPVVPRNKARIRIQLSAAHTKQQLDKAIIAFEKIGKKLNVI